MAIVVWVVGIPFQLDDLVTEFVGEEAAKVLAEATRSSDFLDLFGGRSDAYLYQRRTGDTWVADIRTIRMSVLLTTGSTASYHGLMRHREARRLNGCPSITTSAMIQDAVTAAVSRRTLCQS